MKRTPPIRSSTFPSPRAWATLSNVVIAATAHALIAMSGAYGTLSEIAIGLKLGKRVVSLGREQSPAGVVAAANAREAVRMALGDA